ncbi:hypothetical protein [Natrinema caseinilyticum]|uniref:hypothetical protein n=1 Tax=Natrinema caseinilyticum TaxID=2961570 RepID=UPI0020C36263|nr:hypothetical protein [Natrinema caseinilyticum]
MSRWRDERAVLLLAIVFAALALYQVNVVPAENQARESEHNEQVHNEMLDLRNAIRNVGTTGGSRSVSVTLGTQYTPRTVTANPLDPSGALKTTGTATVDIDAQFAGDKSDYDGNPGNLTGTHETTTLAYVPDYNEYRTAPTTRIEHGLVYNDFGDASVSLSEHGLLSDGTIRLVLLEGTVSEKGRTATSLDPTILRGPSDEIPISPRDGQDTITLSIPTGSPTAWNKTIGETLDAGESGARVTSYADGTLTIELADRSDQYTLQMARVGIGDAEQTDTEFDVERRDGGDGEVNVAYEVEWTDPSDKSGADPNNCDAESCNVVGNSIELTINTTKIADGASVEYAVSNQSVGTVTPSEAETDSEGTHTTRFDVASGAKAGDTVFVYTSSGSDGDRIRLTITSGKHSPPSVNVDAATYNTKGPFWDPKFDVTVDWSATDNDDLSGGSPNEVRLIDTSGSVVDTKSISPTGRTDSGRVTFKNLERYPDGWTVEVAVSNTHDLRDTDSGTVTSN